MLINNMILFLSMAIPMGIVIVGLLMSRAWRKRDKRRSPLTGKVLNLPGEHLRQEIGKHTEAYSEAASIALFIGPVFLSVWLLMRRPGLDWSRLRLGLIDVEIAVIALAVVGWCLWKMVVNGKKYRHYREGLDAELAVAQSLTQLIAEGGLVFHDFPADRFNIDHIVVGRSVVFAVETKSRRKPEDKGSQAARITYDGARLKYPSDHVETKPVEQARYQAEWLAKFLASGAGETVRVVPVVALPGWYVEQTNRGQRHDVLVTNCHNPMFMMGDKFGPPISESLRKRIAHALFEKYPSLDEFLGDRA